MNSTSIDSLERSLLNGHRTRNRQDESTSNFDEKCFSCSSPKCQLLILSAAFFFVFTGFSGAQNLESSLNLGSVSGSVSVGIIYVVFTLACLIAPLIVKLLSPKNALLFQFVIIVTFCISNIYPRVWTMYPAAALLGFGAAPMWVAQGEYVTTFAERHYMMMNEDVYGLFNGIFYGFFQLTQVSGNLISAFVLQSGSKTKTPTFSPTSLDWSAHFFESTDKESLPEITKLALFVSYAAFGGIGCLVLMLWVNRLEHKDEHPEASEILDSGRYKSIGQEIGTGPNISSTFRLIARPQMFLIIPIMLTNGLEMGFAWSSLTGNIITRNLGQKNIGYCMIVFGGADTLSCFFFGKVSDKVGKIICISLAFLVQNACIAWLYLYFDDLHKEDWVHISAICAVWGFCDGILNTLLSALLGKWFQKDKEAAFANWKMWQSLGVSVIFFCQDSLYLNTKLLVVAISWCIGMVGLIIAKVLAPKEEEYPRPSTNTHL